MTTDLLNLFRHIRMSSAFPRLDFQDHLHVWHGKWLCLLRSGCCVPHSLRAKDSVFLTFDHAPDALVSNQSCPVSAWQASTNAAISFSRMNPEMLRCTDQPVPGCISEFSCRAAISECICEFTLCIACQPGSESSSTSIRCV